MEHHRDRPYYWRPRTLFFFGGKGFLSSLHHNGTQIYTHIVNTDEIQVSACGNSLRGDSSNCVSNAGKDLEYWGSTGIYFVCTCIIHRRVSEIDRKE